MGNNTEGTVEIVPIDFTPAERAAFDERQRKTQALLQRMANSTPEESDRLAGQFFHELRAGRRISTARGAKTSGRAPRRTNGSSGRPRAQATRSSAASGDSPDDPSEPPRPGWRMGPSLRPGGLHRLDRGGAMTVSGSARIALRRDARHWIYASYAVLDAGVLTVVRTSGGVQSWPATEIQTIVWVDCDLEAAA